MMHGEYSTIAVKMSMEADFVFWSAMTSVISSAGSTPSSVSVL